MYKRSIYILILFSMPWLSFHTIHGQQKDFQAWPNMQVNLEVVRNLKLVLEEEVRFRENLSQIERQINDFGVSYRFNQFFKAAVYYRLEAAWKNPDEYSWRNGVYGDLSFRVQSGRFTLGYRLRMQSSKVELNDKENPWFDGLRNRHKFTLEYDIKDIPLTPFLEGELFMHLGGSEGSSLVEYRAWAGINYAINKKHEIGIKYGIDRELNVPDPEMAFIVALGYRLNLKLSSAK